MTDSLGRQILLSQLRFMSDHRHTVELDRLDAAEVEICAKYASALDIPADLLSTFYAYCLEYIVAYYDPAYLSGIFLDTDDILKSTYNKLYYFYSPIFDLVRDRTGVNVNLRIEPSYEDYSHITAVVYSYKHESLLLPFVAYNYAFKTWYPLFDCDAVADSVYEFLEEVYHSTVNTIELGVRANRMIATSS